MLSITDDEENDMLLQLKTEANQTTKRKETTSYSLMDAAIKTPDVSFVLEPLREELPRSSKLSRSRAPLNQPKVRDSGTHFLMPSDATPVSLVEARLNASVNGVTFSSTTLQSDPKPNENEEFNSLALNRMDARSNADTKLSPVQSAVTSFASNFEPELVLSPAKLGQ